MAAEGSASEDLETSFFGLVGANDLLIVGPGVLGRLVAEKWREVKPILSIDNISVLDCDMNPFLCLVPSFNY